MESDLGELEEAPTRSELLRQRGYPPEIVNGNGRTPVAGAPATDPVGPVHLADTDPAALAANGERICARPGCGASLEGKRANARFCSDACARAEQRRKALAAPGLERHDAGKPDGSAPRGPGAPGPPAPVPQGGDRLVEVVRTLTAAGLTVTVEVDGLTVRVGA